MPNCSGFLNGYAPTFTQVPPRTDDRKGALLSFQYYLDPDRTVQQAAADIRLLAKLNSHVEPYFLPIHVREFSTVQKVAEILKELPADEFQLVPTDTFMALANMYPTYVERYGQ